MWKIKLRKLFYLIIFIFPTIVGFILILFNLWLKETKKLEFLLKREMIMTNNKWELNSLIGYDNGLTPSIKGNVMIGLQNNLKLNIIKDLKINFYYGYVDKNNFYDAKEIDFFDFNNSNIYIFWFTVGIFATEKSKFYGNVFFEFDYRPIWNFFKNKFIKFESLDGKIDNIDKLINSWNKLLNNSIIIDNFNEQFKKMNLNIIDGIKLQPGQITLNNYISFFIKLSDKFISEKNNLLIINCELFKYIPEWLQSSLFKLPKESFLINTI